MRGKGTQRRYARPEAVDHPRVCGEKVAASSVLSVAAGSPPRMRGKVLHRGTSLLASGITPAYAGKRIGLAAVRVDHRDHPRVCGEKATGNNSQTAANGSPPRMRGKVQKRCSHIRVKGITPAYAGKSLAVSHSRHSAEDHPRVCGEKVPDTGHPENDGGSPPRMRGKESKFPTMAQPSGITPAYAGKSVKFCPHSPFLKDHPRVCGEKAGLAVSLAGRLGSPPRMRGKVYPAARQFRQLGITPAYAGKSGSPARQSACRVDHPRVCGEKTKKIP